MDFHHHETAYERVLHSVPQAPYLIFYIGF